MTRRSYLTALHESGHATVALALGLQVGDVKVGRRRDGAGWLLGYAEIWPEATRKVSSALVFAAGAGADRAARTRAYKAHWEVDRQYFEAYAGGGADWHVSVAVTSAMLGGPLRRPWLAIADALLERDLTGSEVASIFAACRI